MDVDLSTDLAALAPLTAPLISGHSDVAIGTRLAPGARVVRGARPGGATALAAAPGGSIRRCRDGTVNLRSCGRSANHISLIRHTGPGE